MPKIKILCTSTGCLEYAPKRYEEQVAKIGIIRIHMHFMGKEYLEGIGFAPEDFYKTMENVKDVKKSLPHTSIPTYEEVAAQFQKAIDEGYKEILVIALSSYLGGTWNFIRIVAQDYQDKIKIVVVDAKITCFQEGLLALMAQRMVDEGKEIPEILQEIEWAKAHQEFLGVAGNLDYLILNGRLKGGKAYMGKLMNICPAIHFNHAGELVPLCNAIGFVRALRKTNEYLKQWMGDRNPEDYILFRSYTGESLRAKQKRLETTDNIPAPNHEDVIMSCVTGINVGPWVVAYCYSPIRRKDEELPPVPDYYYEQLGIEKPQ